MSIDVAAAAGMELSSRNESRLQHLSQLMQTFPEATTNYIKEHAHVGQFDPAARVVIALIAQAFATKIARTATTAASTRARVDLLRLDEAIRERKTKNSNNNNNKKNKSKNDAEEEGGSPSPAASPAEEKEATSSTTAATLTITVDDVRTGIQLAGLPLSAKLREVGRIGFRCDKKRATLAGKKRTGLIALAEVEAKEADEEKKSDEVEEPAAAAAAAADDADMS